MLTLLVSSSRPMRRKCAFSSQYKNGFQKLLLSAVHVTRKSRNGGTFEPVQAATTSCMVQGVAITMKPSDMAAIVFVAEPRNRRSGAIGCMGTWMWHRMQ